jgi:uncharacterized protein (DUF1684 family)
MKLPVFLVLSLLVASRGLGQTAAATDRLSPAAHSESVAAFQRELNQEFRDPKTSPLSPEKRSQLKSLPFYPVDYAYYVEAQFVRDSTAQPFPMVTSTERRPLYRKYGELRFVLNGQPQRLNVYQGLDVIKKPGYADYLFVPFTDLTNGRGSYGGGRYIDLRQPAAGATTMQLDFNKAYNPSCAYGHRFSCPVPPIENRLQVEVPAGVRTE